MAKPNISFVSRWFPPRTDKITWETALRKWYSTNSAYHEMTADESKINHPQVRLLMSLVQKDGRYAEVGCGGGVVTRAVSQGAYVVGIDVSEVALREGKKKTIALIPSYVCAETNLIPFKDKYFDGVYSFEVLEHVWDPVQAMSEMVRITRPGGFILISTPNRFSLDLHIPKTMLARWADYCAAGIRFVYDKVKGHTFVNLEPDLCAVPYPDCDMVTTLIPDALARMMEKLGCRIEFCDSTYMAAQREGSMTTLAFQRNTKRWFERNYGDSLLILAYRKSVLE